MNQDILKFVEKETKEKISMEGLGRDVAVLIYQGKWYESTDHQFVFC